MSNAAPTLKTDVAIIGSGPAGLLLGHILRQAEIDAVIVERKDRGHVEGRIQAGLLEQTTTKFLDQLGLGARKDREGLCHEGFLLTDSVRSVRIDMAALAGRTMTIYGQTEITKDLISAAPDRDLEIVWNAEDVALHDVETDQPWVTWHDDQEARPSTPVSSLDATAIMAYRGSEYRKRSERSASGSIPWLVGHSGRRPALR